MNAMIPTPPRPRAGPPLAGERLARARLARTPRIGPVTFHEMLGHFGSAEAALSALPGLAQRAGFAEAPVPPAADVLHREAQRLTQAGGRFIVHGDPDYPAALAHIADAPPLLSAIGDLDLLRRPLLAIVGARNASVNGRRLAGTLAGELGAEGFVIVSGLARGIDTAAHRAALDTGTIAVLAGGADVIYPPENDGLWRDIAGRGLILSEAPLGADPQARHFPRRNRIVSGLSLGVLVVEAALQSGSLITARQAADQGREVFAVPGSPLDPRCRGSNRLIRDGAHLVEEAADVLAHLPPPRPGAGGPPHPGLLPLAPPIAPSGPADDADELPNLKVTESNLMTRATGSPVARLPKTFDIAPQALETPRDSIVNRILTALGRSPTPVDELIRECHVSPALMTAALLDLELSGKVERLQGNLVALI